jgi:hypothetical protein
MQKILLLILITVFAWNAFPQRSNFLFKIERSTNKNVVYYEAKQNKDGLLDAKTPVHAYWILWQKDSTGKTCEELNVIEKRMAFGFNIVPVAGTQRQIMRLVSCPNRPIDVSVRQGKAVAEMSINNKTAILDKIFISSRETRFLPKVNYMELFGKDVATGELRYEKVFPDCK